MRVLPTGTVTFVATDGVTTVTLTGTLSGGTTSVTTSGLVTAGAYIVTATYSGDGELHRLRRYGHADGGPGVDDHDGHLRLRTRRWWGQPVTFTADVAPVAPGAGTPTGTVTFVATDGVTTVALTGTLSGGTTSVTTSGLVTAADLHRHRDLQR